MPNSAKFIVFEGLEGAGKSTQIKTATDFLKKREINFIQVREPGGTLVAEKLRDIIKYTKDEEISPQAEILMLYAARKQLIEQKIKPALAQGLWVIADRHDMSSQAYQGYGRGFLEITKQLKNTILPEINPDLTLYFDIDPMLGLTRARSRSELDRIESLPLDFFQRARLGFCELVKQDPKAYLIDASLDIKTVATNVETILSNFINTNKNNLME